MKLKVSKILDATMCVFGVCFLVFALEMRGVSFRELHRAHDDIPPELIVITLLFFLCLAILFFLGVISIFKVSDLEARETHNIQGEKSSPAEKPQ